MYVFIHCWEILIFIYLCIFLETDSHCIIGWLHIHDATAEYMYESPRPNKTDHIDRQYYFEVKITASFFLTKVLEFLNTYMEKTGYTV